MFKIYKKKLLIELIIILVSVISLISGATIIYFDKTNTNELKNQLKLSAENMITLSTKAYQLPLFNFDSETIDVLNESFLLNKIFVAVNAYSDSELISSSYKQDFQSPKTSIVNSKQPFKITDNTPDLVKIESKIYFRGNCLGKIELFYTESFVNQEILVKREKLIISFFIMAIGIILAIYFFLKRSFIEPIVSLAAISDKIAKTYDYSVRVVKKRDDEIGALYDGFKNMLENINNREKELKKTKSYLNNIIESMPSMLISIDENSLVTQWNQAAVEATGIHATNILGKNILEIAPLFSDFLKNSKEVISRKKTIHLYRQHLSKSDNHLRNISFYPLTADEEKGIVIRIDDITEIEEKEDQLRQIQKMETVGTLAGGLAHDFNNVLGGIIGTLSIIRMKIKRNKFSLEELPDHLEIMEQSGQRASDMVQQLLTLSRKNEVNFIPVDLNLSLKHVLKICQNTFDKSILLNPHLSDTSVMINADPTQIEQVLLNLCVNASHAMTIMKKDDEIKGGTLSISIEKMAADNYFCISHPEAEEKNYWKIMVSDDGIGMDSKTIAKIFEPFFTTKDKGKGTGLGLAMVYNIIKQHQGFIDVYSEIGLGTTFSVYLPILNRDIEILENIEDLSYLNGNGLILVVDDEATMRNQAKLMLEECGYTLIFAEDGSEGIEQYKKFQKDIDMVLLDMVMPKKSGKEVFEEIRRINSDAKILLCSGFKKDERITKIMDLGVNGFVQKPYTLESLAKAAFEVIKQY